MKEKILYMDTDSIFTSNLGRPWRAILRARGYKPSYIRLIAAMNRSPFYRTIMLEMSLRSVIISGKVEVYP